MVSGKTEDKNQPYQKKTKQNEEQRKPKGKLAMVGRTMWIFPSQQ